MLNHTNNIYLEIVESHPESDFDDIKRYFSEGIRHLAPPDKAIQFLIMAFTRFGDPFYYVDQEIVIYFKSQGVDCGKQIDIIESNWKDHAKQTIKRFAKGEEHVWFDNGKKHSKFENKRSIKQASNITDFIPYHLPNFWQIDINDVYSDASILRTAFACKIAGFEQWWERLHRWERLLFLEGGVFQMPCSFWLFAMCRSDIVLLQMKELLVLGLESLKITHRDNLNYSWISKQRFEGNDREVTRTCLSILTSIVFVSSILDTYNETNLVYTEATKDILACQNSDGGWGLWWCKKPEYCAKSSAEITAMAIHALFFARPFGWENAIRRGVNWLMNNQTYLGCWRDASTSYNPTMVADPFVPYLTVLVMDAIELSKQLGNKFYVPILTFAYSIYLEEENPHPINVNNYYNKPNIGQHVEIHDVNTIGVINFTQLLNSMKQDEHNQLVKELAELRKKMKEKTDDSPEKDQAIGAIADAEMSLKSKNYKSAFESLKRAGRWAMEVAKDIFADIAAKLIGDSLGIGNK